MTEREINNGLGAFPIIPSLLIGGVGVNIEPSAEMVDWARDFLERREAFIRAGCDENEAKALAMEWCLMRSIVEEAGDEEEEDEA